MRFKILLIFCLCMIALPSAAQDADLVISEISSGNISADAVAHECVRAIRQVLLDAGRSVPMERVRVAQLFPSGMITDDTIKEAALKSGINVYWLVSASQAGNNSFGEIMIVTVDGGALSRKTITVKSSIVQNIPLLLSRESAYLFKGLPVRATIRKKISDTEYLIDAGQWQGLKDGAIYRTASGSLRIIQSLRFSSVIAMDHAAEGTVVQIDMYPDTDAIIDDLDRRIRSGIIRKHGIEYTKLTGPGSSEKRLIEATAVINTGASLIVPGYGSFLSTYYLGFNDPLPDYAGMSAGVAAEAIQLCAVPVMSGFKTNFFPWIQDADKNERLNALHIYLWSSIPATFAATYFDQLAVQYRHHRVLPPRFENADTMAAVSSLIIPGGGQFYKGNRLAGWGFYTMEMGLLGYASYTMHREQGRYAFAGFAAVKLLDVAIAYFSETGYEFYLKEFERKKYPTADISFCPEEQGGMQCRLAAVYQW